MMFKYYQPLQNKSGDVLPGYLLRLFTPTGDAVDLFADENGTPIVSESGIANAAKADDLGMVRFYVLNGTYDIRQYSPDDEFLGVETGVPIYEASGVYDDLASSEENKGASLVKSESGDTVQQELDARPTTDDLASTSGAGMVGDLLDLPDTEGSTQSDWNRDRISVMRWVPVGLRAGIRLRSGTADLATYLQKALDGCPPGATLYFPDGYYPFDTTLSIVNSTTISGDPGQDIFDNSFDYGTSGAALHYRGTSGNGISVAPPDEPSRRINLYLANFALRGGYMTHSATSGNGVDIDGRNQSQTFVRVTMDNFHVSEFPDRGVSFAGNVYGGKIDNFMAYRCGGNGIGTTAGSNLVGEFAKDRIRIFQCGLKSGTAKEQASFLWEAGLLKIGQISVSEGGRDGLMLGAGPTSIAALQCETNAERSLVVGISGSAASLTLGTAHFSPGASFTGTVIDVTADTIAFEHGPLLFNDSLGVGGKHIHKASGAGQLYGHTRPRVASGTLVIDDDSNTGDTYYPLRVFGRNAAGASDVTGDLTDVPLTIDQEITDEWGCFNAATGVFTAPFSGTFRFTANIGASGITSGHDRASVKLDSSSYARTIRMGNVGAMVDANGQLGFAPTIPAIPLAQGETARILWNVGGSSKVVDQIADSAMNGLSIEGVH